MDRIFEAENAAGLARLTPAVQRLTPADLVVAMPAGWTVAGVLGHLAFWDLRAAQVVRRGAVEGPRPSPIDTDLVNEAMRPILAALAPEGVKRLVLESAAAAAGAVAAAPDDLLAAINAAGGSLRPDRRHHWDMHLDEIEQALASAVAGHPRD